MRFKSWEADDKPSVVDAATAKEGDRTFGNAAAVIGNGLLMGYHLTDNPEQTIATIYGKKKLTATYRKGMGKYSELGPGLYVSAAPQLWIGRSTGKYDFLKNLTDPQRIQLAKAILKHPNLVGQKFPDGQVYRYVSRSEEQNARRWVSEWLRFRHNPTLTLVADQPYNIKFWSPEFLKPLGIQPAAPPKLLRVEFTGKFINLGNHVGNWPIIADAIRQGLDGGFNPGGMGYPELCIWRKEVIRDIQEEAL